MRPPLPAFVEDVPLTLLEGEMGYATLLADTHVVKQPRERDSPRLATIFEALVVAELRNKDEAPLIVPNIINCGHTRPYYNLFTQVPGETLSSHDALSFSKSEKQRLGHKIGEFTAWMTTALDLTNYQQIIQDVEGRRPRCRTYFLEKYTSEAKQNTVIDETLADILIGLEHEREDLYAAGLLDPTMVGHDDLRPANITFDRSEGHHEPIGVIDFGIAQPSRPERELRHMAMLGQEVLAAACASFEERSGQMLNPDLIRFWAVAQAASTCAYATINHRESAVKERRAALERLIPGLSW